MASVQERLQLKRVPLDKWSISEQLHLASAVACSGDQNWMSVSRSLKVMCGASRPSDWFSQKSCAAQYGKLLENVETPKRKKRNEKDTSQAAVETPSELILRKLTQERINELKKIIGEERQEYLKIKDETISIQNGMIDENQLREWWEQIELEEKQREKEKQLHAQWLKEREERKRELERALRPNAHFFQASPNQSPTKAPHLNVKVKLEEMEVDDSSSRQGTSPLLTSLLKSPSPAPNPGASILHNVMNLQGNQIRVSAPTITNLLTGSITNLSSSLAAVTQQNLTKTIASSSAAITTPFPAQIQTHTPLTGPPPHDHMASNILQSPSQAAPTLSLLLENKHKESMQQKMPPLARIEQPVIIKSEQAPQIIHDKQSINAVETAVPENEVANSPMKDEDQQLMEVLHGLIPDNIDELADILTENNAIILNPELLEEESILDNVDDLIGEEEAVATTATTPASSNTPNDNKDFEKTVDINVPKNLNEVPPVVAEIQPPVENTINQEEQKSVLEIQSQAKTEVIQEKVEQEKVLETKPNELESDRKATLLKEEEEEESSDLSNDTPLAELIKQESEKAKLKEVKREEPDGFESDSNDDKSLESIKRGIQAIQDNESNENSTDTSDVKQVSSVTEEEQNTSADKPKEEEAEPEMKQVEDDQEVKEEVKPEQETVKDDVESVEEKMEVKEEPSVDVKKEMIENESAVEQETEAPKIEEKDSAERYDAIADAVEDERNEVEKQDTIILAEEKDDAIADESLSKTPTTEKIDTEIKIDEQSGHLEAFNETTTTNEPERKVSTDEEIFEAAKKHLENIKSENIEQITEPAPSQQTITIVDTDDDSPIEVIKEHKTGRTKRDYSRRKQESSKSIDKRSEGTTSSDDVPNCTNTRLRLRERDRDRSESPYIDEESGEPAAKNKRRYSTNPIIDSLPNSPASSDDRDYRGWKKSILLVYNGLITHRYASLFTKPISDDAVPNYKEIVLQPMDLQTLKRNIDNGTLRTTLDFKRYVMVMCYNAIFYNFNDEFTCSRAKEMLTDGLALIEDIMNTWKKENQKTNAAAAAAASVSSSSSATKTVRGRKSNRLMN